MRPVSMLALLFSAPESPHGNLDFSRLRVQRYDAIMRLKNVFSIAIFNRTQNTSETLMASAEKKIKKNMRLKVETFNRTFQSQKHKNYNAATFFSSSVIARLMKSLIVVPVAATNAATRE